MVKKFATVLGVVLMVGSMVWPLLNVAKVKAAPTNITLSAYDDYLLFDWDETSGAPVDDYTLEFWDGADWIVTADGVSSNTYFIAPRSYYQNEDEVTLRMRITTEFSDESTSDPIEANLTLPAFEGVDFTVGETEEVNSYDERIAEGLNYWLDGNIGFFEWGDEIYSVTANGPNTALIRKDDTPILGTVIDNDIAISNQEQDNDHISGGPVYHDKVNNRLYMFYHAEFQPNPDPFYAYIGMAYSDDGGQVWEDLGQIITPGINIDDEDRVSNTDLGGGPYAIKDGKFYVFFKETLDDLDPYVKLGVATADVEDVIAAGELGNKVDWHKWNGTDFTTEPGIEGEGADVLWIDQSDPYWMDVAFIDSLDRFVMVYSNYNEGDWRHIITTSSDGIHWEAPQIIKSGTTDEIRYLSISSTNFAMQRDIREDSFYVYYTRSEETNGGVARWNDAWGERYEVSFDVPTGYDGDEDGVPDAEEQAGINDGDGNGDGTPDYQQSNVATAANSVTDATTTIEASGSCDEISEFSVVSSDSLGSDGDYSYPVGLNDFTLNCASAGQSATVKVYYDQLYDTDSWELRKYIDSNYAGVSGEVIGTATVGDETVTTVTYSLTDGGSLDEDGTANAVIVDPAGLAEPGDVAGSSSSDSLADTGAHQLTFALVSGLASLAGFLVVRNSSTKQQNFKR